MKNNEENKKKTNIWLILENVITIKIQLSTRLLAFVSQFHVTSKEMSNDKTES